MPRPPRRYHGLEGLEEDGQYKLVPKESLIKEITDKGKIADLYVIKAEVEKCGLEEVMIVKDEKEVYGDNGFVICLTEADKENFVAYIAAGKGLPPPVEK